MHFIFVLFFLLLLRTDRKWNRFKSSIYHSHRCTNRPQPSHINEMGKKQKRKKKQKHWAREQVNIKQCFVSVLVPYTSLYLHATNGSNPANATQKPYKPRALSVSLPYTHSRFLLKKKKTKNNLICALYYYPDLWCVYNVLLPVKTQMLSRFGYVYFVYIYFTSILHQKPNTLHSFTLVLHTTHISFNFPNPIIIHLKFIDLVLFGSILALSNAATISTKLPPELDGNVFVFLLLRQTEF